MKKSIATIIIAIMLVIMTAVAVGKVVDFNIDYFVSGFDKHNDLFDLDDWFN